MSATTNVEIYIELRDYLEQYAGLPPVVYPGERFDPPSTGGIPDLYWLIQDARMPVQKLYAGDTTPDEYTGTFQVHIMAPEQVTHSQLMYQVGLVANHFAKSTDLWLSSGRLQVMQTPYLATDPYMDGIYRRAPVLVPWRTVG